MFVTNWISTTKIQKISEITNFFRHYFLSRTEVRNVQNSNDSDAEYREKNKQRIKGFVTNITETVPEKGKPSLLTGVTQV